MPMLRTRSGSRDGSTMDPNSVVRRSSSCDQSDCSSLREALLHKEESGGEVSPPSTGTVKNRSPPSHRQSLGSPTTTKILDSNNLPSLPIHYQHSNSNNNNSTIITRWYTPLLNSIRHNPDSTYIGIALVAWYLVGVLAICTTKLLLSTPLEDGGVPSPLVLTFQQMFLGSTVFLKTFLRIKGRLTGVGIQAWPVEEGREKGDPTNTIGNNSSFNFKAPLCWFQQHAVVVDFLLLAGLFNGLDFLASNTCFSHSSASFVETIKASEPITTTGLAIWWGIDRLGKLETLSLTVLISGVLISTYANATASDSGAAAEEAPVLSESIKTVLTVMTANLCFAFRAMCQKLLRSTPTGNSQNLDDFNLLFRMQQTGAASLLLPVLLFQHHKLYQVLLGRESWNVLGYYVGLSLVNAWAFATYSLASCFILSRISVVQHSGFGCLRRLFAIVATSIAFGVPIHALGGIGILMSILGFSGFTHYRFKKEGKSHRHQSSSNNKSQPKKLLSSNGTDRTSASLTSSGSMGHSSDEAPWHSSDEAA